MHVFPGRPLNPGVEHHDRNYREEYKWQMRKGCGDARDYSQCLKYILTKFDIDIKAS